MLGDTGGWLQHFHLVLCPWPGAPACPPRCNVEDAQRRGRSVGRGRVEPRCVGSWLARFGARGFRGKGNCWVPAWVWRASRWRNRLWGKQRSWKYGQREPGELPQAALRQLGRGVGTGRSCLRLWGSGADPGGGSAAVPRSSPGLGGGCGEQVSGPQHVGSIPESRGRRAEPAPGGGRGEHLHCAQSQIVGRKVHLRQE